MRNAFVRVASRQAGRGCRRIARAAVGCGRLHGRLHANSWTRDNRVRLFQRCGERAIGMPLAARDRDQSGTVSVGLATWPSTRGASLAFHPRGCVTGTQQDGPWSGVSNPPDVIRPGYGAEHVVRSGAAGALARPWLLTFSLLGSDGLHRSSTASV